MTARPPLFQSAARPRCTGLVAATLLLANSPAMAAPDFAREVRPIFEKSCLGCHGPTKQKGGYRLDVRASALKGGDSGERAIIPHDPQASPLIRFVSGEDEEMTMPPPKSDAPPLTPGQIEILKAWIAAGPGWPDALAGDEAAEPPPWALQPLRQPDVPGPETNPIDAFIHATLAGHHLEPSPAAEPPALLRRLCYDLTGLPPSPDDLAAWLANPSPQAYGSLVDRLLASPRYGEHWARHWLDVANYADTHGNDHDYARPNAWPYRDYVIRSLNEDMPYPRFVQEQIAGDVLFPDDPLATVALGFLAAGPWDHTLMVTVREDTVDHRMAQNLDRDAMVSTVMGTFQSLTVHCARCHDHKFDPISQREYYSLQAVFAGVDRADRPFDADPRIHAQRQHLLAAQRALQHREPALLASLDAPEIVNQVAAWEQARSRQEGAWQPFDIISVISTGGSSLTRQPDGSWLAGGPRPDRDTYIVTARRRPGRLGAIRLDVLPDDRLPQHGPGRWDNGNFHLTEIRAFAAMPGAAEGSTPVVFGRASADYDEGPAISAAQAIDGNSETQWGIHPRYGERHQAVFTLKEPADFPEGTTFTFLIENQSGAPGHGIGRFSLSACDDTPSPAVLAPLSVDLTAILRLPEPTRTRQQRQELALAVLTTANQISLAALPTPQFVYAVASDFPADGANFKPPTGPRPIHVLARGELGKPAELVGPGTLGCVPGLSRNLVIANVEDESARRAALAQWLTEPANALTWRSIVNRVWHHHFGRGLCDTPNDFGRMGGSPSHPELLDWLATWFRDEAKGSLKALHRLIVTSETWRQSTLADQGSSTDSDNRMLWRQNRRRLSGEQVRDTLLALSGQLDLTMGGPSAIQFIHHDNATFMPGGNPAFLDYDHFDPDSPAARRRAIYRFVFRTVPDPLMDALDCPDSSATTPARSVSTTALQALAQLNNTFLVRQCEHLAARLVTPGSTLTEQVSDAFCLILLRPPRPAEFNQFVAYAGRHGLPNACHLLINTNEFLYVD